MQRKYRPNRPDFLPAKRELESAVCCVVTECERPVKSFGMCSMHYARWHRTGSTYRPSTPLEKYLAAVDKGDDDECWLSKRQVGGMGYGNIRLGKRQVSPHRLAWELFVGPIPPGMFVLHHCDTPACSNPKHLWIGSNQDNVDDKVRKGRHNTKKKSQDADTD